MKKRRMPAHIVLPNGMWRFVKRGAKKARSVISRSTRRKARRIKTRMRSIGMARRKYRGRSRGGGFGMRAPLPVGGMVGDAVKGVGAAALAKRFVGAPLGTFTGAAVGFAVGGLGGALGGYLHDNVGNVGGAQSSGTTLYG